MNSDKKERLLFKQDGAIYTIDRQPLKLIDHFTLYNSNISSTKKDVNIYIEQALKAIERL